MTSSEFITAKDGGRLRRGPVWDGLRVCFDGGSIMENESVVAMCAHCKQSLFREIPSGQLMHVNGLRTCRKEGGVYGAERVETAAANLLLNEECRAVTLSGDDYWAIPRDVYDELRAMLEDWPK